MGFDSHMIVCWCSCMEYVDNHGGRHFLWLISYKQTLIEEHQSTTKSLEETSVSSPRAATISTQRYQVSEGTLFIRYAMQGMQC